jgi:hypothetical protein
MFKIGDVVTWGSQAAGSWKVKTGAIVAVVPSGSVPDRDKFKKLYKGSGIGFPRKHESYVVEVYKDPVKMTGHAIYWPLAAKLRAA